MTDPSGPLLSIGECMIELAPEDRAGADGPLYRLGIAGDTLNTAWYARACLTAGETAGETGAAVSYLTMLGHDPQSDAILGFLDAAGIGTGDITRHPDRRPGLYLISLRNGERSFSYWRDSSAARCLAEDGAHLGRAISGAGTVFLSGITVAILPAAGRDRLAACLAASRAAGTRIAFDPNIRPALWSGPEEAGREITRFAGLADILLPSFDDEAAQFGDAHPADTLARYRALGAQEVVVKNGGGPVLACHGDAVLTLPPAAPDALRDTTGAGDSFNGAYLAARLRGLAPEAAIGLGVRIAAAVIGHPGALMPMARVRALAGVTQA